MTAPLERIKGFTLIEITIVLVVIGLLLSGGLLAVAPVLQNSRVTETNSKLDLIENALLLYALRNSCLPCPATGNLLSTNANAGLAVDDTQGTYQVACATDACTNLTQGIVPWRNLGLSEADITDGFGARISYAVTSNLAQAPNMERVGTVYPQGALQVNNAGGVNVTSVEAAAYVLISHGPDNSFAFAPESGSQAADPNGSANQTANSNGTPFVQNELLGTAGATYFDDIVRWRTGPILVQLCGVGRCGNPS